jgi:methyl-accepting chemotaxis protein
MANFNNQFATQKLRQETSVTSTGAGMTPSTVNNPATQDWYTTKNKKKVKKEEEQKDVEPKLAAGKAKVYMKDKWGWKDAPSIPNRPSKGGFMYSQIFEELSKFVKENKLNIKDIRSFNYNISKVREAIRQMRDENSEQLYKDLESLRFQTDLMSAIDILDKLKLKIDKNPKLDKITIADALQAIEDIRNEYKPEEQGDDEGKFDWYAGNDKLNESYSKFKTETKTRGKSDQFHQAVREVRRKVQEINRLFEYVSRLKTELSEGEGGLKYKMHTEKALAKIKEMVSELNQNIKKFK